MFTLDIWNPNNKIELTSESVTRVVSISRSKYLPYLDTAMFWIKDNNLQFMVHKKKDQKLKYLNKGSSHPNSCFCAIPYRVFLRLCKLTLQTKMNLRKSIDDLYLDHASALCKTNLVQGNFPTMEELWNEVEKRRKRTNKEVELNKDINSEIQELNNNSPTENENEPRKRSIVKHTFALVSQISGGEFQFTQP